MEPTTIRKLVLDVYPAFGMLAAAKLGLFTALSIGPTTVEGVAERLGVEPVRLVQLLYMLVDAGLLACEAGVFRNTAESDEFLVEGKPGYMGGLHELWSHIWSASLKTADSIRMDAPQYRWMSLSEPDRESYLRGLGVLSKTIGREILQRWDLRGYRSVVDVAGGSGTLVSTICDALPHLRGAVLEHPSTVPVTRRLLAERGDADRIDVVSGDVLAGDLTGQWDVAIVRNFIQMLTADEAARALTHIAGIVAPGGCIVLCDMVLDDTRLSPQAVLRLGIIFVNLFDRTPMYVESEYKAWMANAGFVGWDRAASSLGHVMARCEKPGPARAAAARRDG